MNSEMIKLIWKIIILMFWWKQFWFTTAITTFNLRCNFWLGEIFEYVSLGDIRFSISICLRGVSKNAGYRKQTIKYVPLSFTFFSHVKKIGMNYDLQVWCLVIIFKFRFLEIKNSLSIILHGDNFKSSSLNKLIKFVMHFFLTTLFKFYSNVIVLDLCQLLGQ